MNNRLTHELQINAEAQEPSGKSPGTVGNDGYEQKASRGAPVRDVPVASAPSTTPQKPTPDREALALQIAKKIDEYCGISGTEAGYVIADFVLKSLPVSAMGAIADYDNPGFWREDEPIGRSEAETLIALRMYLTGAHNLDTPSSLQERIDLALAAINKRLPV